MAIKVNGTTVINDSRALSNIASVDATTAAAIGAAGVGGGVWALESTTTISSAVTTVSNIVIPSSGTMAMLVLEEMDYKYNTSYFSCMIRLSVNGGSSYYSGSTDYKKPNNSNRPGLFYRESGQGTDGLGLSSYSAILLQNLPAGQYTTAAWMWGAQYRTSFGDTHEYFDGTDYSVASNRISASTARPDRLQLTNDFADVFLSGKIHMYSYSA